MQRNICANGVLLFEKCLKGNGSSDPMIHLQKERPLRRLSPRLHLACRPAFARLTHIEERSMRRIILTLFLGLNLLTVTSAFVSPVPRVTSKARHRTAVWTNNEIVLHFPESATFRATLRSEVDITSIVLEYGNEQQTCGDVIAKAFPQFTQGKTVHAEWTWEMRQSGSLPPGAQLWWRWRVTDANGDETVTDTQTATWLDNIHPWQTITSDPLYLHYYGIDKEFAKKMLNAGMGGMNRNEKDAGLTTDSPINIYVYP